jgi:hypothetical protein
MPVDAGSGPGCGLRSASSLLSRRASPCLQFAPHGLQTRVFYSLCPAVFTMHAEPPPDDRCDHRCSRCAVISLWRPSAHLCHCMGFYRNRPHYCLSGLCTLLTWTVMAQFRTGMPVTALAVFTNHCHASHAYVQGPVFLIKTRITRSMFQRNAALTWARHRSKYGTLFLYYSTCMIASL